MSLACIAASASLMWSTAACDLARAADDTPFKYTKTADGGRMPPSPAGPKTEMGFVTLKAAAGWTKKKTDKLAGRWSDQMMAAGIDVRGYTIEDNRILFVCDQRGYKDMNRVRAFLLIQPETQEFEWNSKKSYPGAVPLDESGEPAAADPLAKFQAMQDEQAAAAKRAARKLKKDEENRQREMRQAKAKAEKKKKQEAEKKKKEAAKKQQEEAKAAADAANAQQQTKQPEVHTEL